PRLGRVAAPVAPGASGGGTELVGAVAELDGEQLETTTTIIPTPSHRRLETTSGS
ncbi:MAG: hypothetical protein QOE00_2192, partial [Ilumatobacteraceae bacterium]